MAFDRAQSSPLPKPQSNPQRQVPEFASPELLPNWPEGGLSP
jgi:hypothetical protein